MAAATPVRLQPNHRNTRAKPDDGKALVHHDYPGASGGFPVEPKEGDSGAPGQDDCCTPKPTLDLKNPALPGQFESMNETCPCSSCLPA